MLYKLKKLMAFREDCDDKYIVYRHVGSKNKFTIRTFKNGKSKDNVVTYSKYEAMAMCQICGEDY